MAERHVVVFNTMTSFVACPVPHETQARKLAQLQVQEGGMFAASKPAYLEHHGLLEACVVGVQGRHVPPDHLAQIKQPRRLVAGVDFKHVTL